MSLGQPAGTKLNMFGRIIHDAFGEFAYHVGSSLTAKKGEPWRDVDVRLILDDDEFDRMFPGIDDPGRVVLHYRHQALAVVWSEFGSNMTGLPIDFQIQQMTYANTNAECEGPRSPLGLMMYRAEQRRSLGGDPQ